MAGSLRPFSVGWHPVDPGPGPRSSLLDRPPAPDGSDYPVRYSQWRRAVEADTQRLQVAHVSGHHWNPLALPEDVRCLPIYGGRPADIEQVATMLVMSCIESGLGSCRVIDLTGWDLSNTVRGIMSTARHNRAEFEQVGPNVTTANLLGNPDVDELMSLVCDALRVSSDRSGGRRTQQERQELAKVARALAAPATLDRILDAVDVALGSSATPTTLTAPEIRLLRDYHASVVSQRRASQDRLADLHVDLDALRAFQRSTNRTTTTHGAGRLSLRWFDVLPGASVGQTELGRELISRAMLQQFSRPGRAELLVVLGAEKLADEVREELTHAAHRLDKCVAFAFTRLDGPGHEMLGHAGSTLALLLRLPNPADAAAAAEFLGREFKYVINGISIAEGRTQDWSSSYGTTSSHGTSHGSSRSSSSGLSGGAFGFSSSVGSSVTSTFSRGTSTTASAGGSRSLTSTASHGRVHEYVLEPEVFQQLPDGLMFIVHNGAVTLASCDNQLRRSRITSPDALELP